MLIESLQISPNTFNCRLLYGLDLKNILLCLTGTCNVHVHVYIYNVQTCICDDLMKHGWVSPCTYMYTCIFSSLWFYLYVLIHVLSLYVLF